MWIVKLALRRLSSCGSRSGSRPLLIDETGRCGPRLVTLAF